MNLSSGPLRYYRGPAGGYKLIVEVDQEIARYYRWLMPKWIETSPQMYAAHISVVRKEIPPLTDAWGKYEGEVVEFFYDHTVYRGEVYFWLNVFSTRLEDIRVELGLSIEERYTPPPPGFRKTFHTTIGNVKWQTRSEASPEPPPASQASRSTSSLSQLTNATRPACA